jgi:hypothetical protein
MKGPSRGAYRKAPAAIQGAFDKQALLLANDLRHPSLHAKKYDESRDLWQARVSGSWRFYFKIQGDTYQLDQTHLFGHTVNAGRAEHLDTTRSGSPNTVAVVHEQSLRMNLCRTATTVVKAKAKPSAGLKRRIMTPT